ncbi:MAG: thioredoxin family protein [Tepidamorphaceae bacterium]
MNYLIKSLCAGLMVVAASVWTAGADTIPDGVALVMAEEEGCIWCAAWNRDISPEYAITAEGRAAPLVRINIHKALPEGLKLESRLRFTPTFVLVRDGQEISRLEGYAGEDFFWGLLQRMLTNAGIDYNDPR